MAFFAAFSLCGCASTVVPTGAWSRPADLALTPTSFAGARIDLRCGVLAKDGALVERAFPVCTNLREVLSRYGAQEPADDGRADLSFWYIERGIRRNESSALTTWASWLTGFIVPAVSSVESSAELRLFDARGVLLDLQTLSVVRVHLFGWGALPLRFRETPREDEKRIADSFYTFAVNRIYSQTPRIQAVPARQAGL